MSLWDTLTSTVSNTAKSAYDGAGSLLSSAYNKTESVASGFVDSVKQSVSAVGDGLGKLAEEGKIALTMDNGKSVLPSPGPVAPAKKSANTALIVAGGIAVVGLYLLTRKKS